MAAKKNWADWVLETESGRVRCNPEAYPEFSADDANTPPDKPAADTAAGAASSSSAAAASGSTAPRGADNKTLQERIVDQIDAISREGEDDRRWCLPTTLAAYEKKTMEFQIASITGYETRRLTFFFRDVGGEEQAAPAFDKWFEVRQNAAVTAWEYYIRRVTRAIVRWDAGEMPGSVMNNIRKFLLAPNAAWEKLYTFVRVQTLGFSKQATPRTGIRY